MSAEPRLIYKAKTPQKSVTILAASLVAIAGAMLVTGGPENLQLLRTFVPVMAGALVVALVLSRALNRDAVSELAIEDEALLARQWGLMGNGAVLRLAKSAATGWTLVEKHGITLYIDFFANGTRYRLPLYNARFVDWAGLATLAPGVVEAIRNKHGRKGA
jgi:hypothetical protein